MDHSRRRIPQRALRLHALPAVLLAGLAHVHEVAAQPPRVSPPMSRLIENRDVRGISKWLGDDNPTVRTRAVDALVAVEGDTEDHSTRLAAIGALVGALGDSSPEIRGRVAHYLGQATWRWRDDTVQDVINLLCGMLHARDPTARLGAAVGLVKIDALGWRKAGHVGARALMDTLEDAALGTRTEAALAWAETGFFNARRNQEKLGKAAGLLMAALRDTDPQLKTRAAETMQLHWGPMKQIWDAGEAGDIAVALSGVLEDDVVAVRRASAATLKYWCEWLPKQAYPSVVPRLVRALAHRDPEVRAGAEEALVAATTWTLAPETAGLPAVEALLGLLDRPGAEGRLEYAVALARIATQVRDPVAMVPAVETMVRALGRPSADESDTGWLSLPSLWAFEPGWCRREFLEDQLRAIVSPVLGRLLRGLADDEVADASHASLIAMAEALSRASATPDAAGRRLLGRLTADLIMDPTASAAALAHVGDGLRQDAAVGLATEALMEALGSGKAETVGAAAECLAALPGRLLAPLVTSRGDELLAALPRLLGPNGGECVSCVHLLESMGRVAEGCRLYALVRRIARCLGEGLGDPDPSVRLATAEGIAACPMVDCALYRDAFREATHVLRSGDGRRVRALRLISRLAPLCPEEPDEVTLKAAIPVLVGALQTGVTDSAPWAVAALRAVALAIVHAPGEANPVVEALGEALRAADGHSPIGLAWALTEAGMCSDWLDDMSASVHDSASMELGLRVLTRSVSAADPSLSMEAATALRQAAAMRWGDDGRAWQEAAEVLSNILRTGSPMVQAEVAGAFVEIVAKQTVRDEQSIRRGIACLVSLLENSDLRVRIRSAQAWLRVVKEAEGELPTQELAEVLAAALKDDDPEIRALGAEFLSEYLERRESVTDRRGVDSEGVFWSPLVSAASLEASTADTDPRVRRHSVRALRIIALRMTDPSELESAIDCLVTASRDGHAGVRNEAAQALGAIASVLVEWDSSGNVVIQALVESAKTSEGRERVGACYGLVTIGACLGDARATMLGTRVLTEALHDRYDARLIAAKHLIGAPEYVRAHLAPQLEWPKARRKAEAMTDIHGALDDGALAGVRALAEALADGDVGLRREAAQALAASVHSLSNPCVAIARNSLTTASQDADEVVCRLATEALVNIDANKR